MKQVLVTSPNTERLEERRAAIEQAGFAVVIAQNAKQLAIVCRRAAVDIAVIGYLHSSAEKNELAHTVRRYCRTAILVEMCEGTRCVPTADHFVCGTGTEELVRLLVTLKAA